MFITATSHHPLQQALWNLRWLSLFIIGPSIGTGLVDLIFGLPPTLVLLACGMFAFTLILFGILVVGEYRRLKQSTPGI